MEKRVKITVLCIFLFALFFALFLGGFAKLTGNLAAGEQKLVPVNDCSALTSPNTIYTLGKDVQSAGTCFTVQADSITINCNNHIITYAVSQPGDGVFSNKQNTVVKNCIFKKG